MALVGGVAFAIPAVATQWLSSGAVGSTAGMTMTDPVTNQTVTVRAYSTQTAGANPATCSPVGSCPASTSGLFKTANLYTYSGGFGISNTVAGDTNEGIQPEHAVDNNQIYDMLVFELPADGFDLQAFRLGWATEAYDSAVTNEADVQAYFGGNNLGAGYNFANACFTGCTNTGTGTAAKGDLSYLGFTDMNPLITVGSGGGTNVPINTDVTIAGTQSGRYLVLTGALGGTNDAFKVNMIQATGGSGGQTPEPGTLALLALGLFGVVALRRRPALA
jgi:hypothetical protein